MTPSISIAITTFNGEKYLEQQLASLDSQTAPPAEIVAVDDCSQDETVCVLERFANRSRIPVRIFKNEANIGYKRNFLRAASLCRGDAVAYCDQDDVWAEQKLERC